MAFDEPGFEKLKTYSIEERKNIVSGSVLVEPSDPPGDILAGFPDILAARGLKKLCRTVAAARQSEKTVVLAMGAHVIKCGLSLLVIDMMERGILSALAMNGAGAIHDYEIAAHGATSEDVDESLQNGSFGMARETAESINGAAVRAAAEGRGLGEILGREIIEKTADNKNRHLTNSRASILAAGVRLGIPVTVHISLGCDIVHMHPGADGAAIGAASMKDFRVLTGVVGSLEDGVWLNVGSSVVLPEVFLKALTLSRNINGDPSRFLTADFDMIRHYRPDRNVVERPSGTGVAITGHHEIMIPIFRWGVLHEIAGRRKGNRS